MRQKLIAVSLAMAVGSMGLAADAGAKKKKKTKIPTKITLTTRHITMPFASEIFDGFVTSKGPCDERRINRAVTIRREGGGTADVQVATATARSDPPSFGFYSTSPVASGAAGSAYYAVAERMRVSKTVICQEGISPLVSPVF
jgi:hypothetical protein